MFRPIASKKCEMLLKLDILRMKATQVNVVFEMKTIVIRTILLNTYLFIHLFHYQPCIVTYKTWPNSLGSRVSQSVYLQTGKQLKRLPRAAYLTYTVRLHNFTKQSAVVHEAQLSHIPAILCDIHTLTVASDSTQI